MLEACDGVPSVVFPVRPAMAWMRENAIALNQAINQTA